MVGGLLGGPGLATAASRVIAWDPPGQGEAAGRCFLGTREPGMLIRLIEHAVETVGGGGSGDLGGGDASRDRANGADGADGADGGEVGGGVGGVVLFGSSLGAGVSIVAAARLLAGAEGEALRAVVRGVVAEAPYRMPIAPARNVIRGAGFPSFPLPAVYRWFGWRFGAGVSPEWPRAHWGEPFDRAHHAARLSGDGRGGGGAGGEGVGMGDGCPLLVVHGSRDAVSPMEDGYAIVKAAGGELVEVAGAGHNDLWSNAAFRAVVGGAVHGFIGRHGGGGGGGGVGGVGEAGAAG